MSNGSKSSNNEVRRFCSVSMDVVPYTPSFSIVDYRNNYLFSQDLHKILEFYNGFENRDQLIRWFNSKPKGFIKIHEINGEKDVIVVIPTSNFSGEDAANTRDRIFNGMHLIFVESGEPQDPYFNYATSLNEGIRVAMKYDPKWIILSKDNMEKEDDSKQLIKAIKDVERVNPECEYLLAKPAYDYISVNASIVKPRISRKLINYCLPKKSYVRKGFEILNLFKVHLDIKYNFEIRDFIFYKRILDYKCYVSFGIFKKDLLIKSFELFGNYVPFGEDEQISIAASLFVKKPAYIEYRIKPSKGKVLGVGNERYLRGIILSRILMSEYLDKVSKEFS